METIVQVELNSAIVNMARSFIRREKQKQGSLVVTRSTSYAEAEERDAATLFLFLIN